MRCEIDDCVGHCSPQQFSLESDFAIFRLRAWKIGKIENKFSSKDGAGCQKKTFQSSSYKFHNLKLLRAIATWFKLQSNSSLNQFVAMRYEHLPHSLNLLLV